ncbi:MAG: alpha/beta hydrolase, partial [Gaiellaceae bacterium]
WYSLQLDPLNPRTYVFPGDDEDPEWARDAPRSVLEGPDAPAQPWIGARAGTPAGTTELHRFRSEILDNERRVYVYTPPGFDRAGDAYPLLVVFDGWAYVELIPAPTILDNLIAAGRIPPLVAVLPDSLSQEARDRELPCHPPFVEFLTGELLPWARERWHATDDPARTTVAGSSYGGLAAAFAALSRPDVFGNVLSQSGSFGWRPDGGDEPDWLIGQFEATERLPLRFSLDAGLLEEGRPRGWASILEANRRLRGVLEAKGYPVAYAEYAGGHDYICWAGTLADGLLALAREPA